MRIAEEKLEKPKISAEFMTFWLHRFRKLDVTKESHRQMLIDTFVNAVFVHDDKLLLTFNFKDGTRTITLTDAKIAEKKNSGSNLDCLLAPRKKPLLSTKTREVSSCFQGQNSPQYRKIPPKQGLKRSSRPWQPLFFAFLRLNGRVIGVDLARRTGNRKDTMAFP